MTWFLAASPDKTSLSSRFSLSTRSTCFELWVKTSVCYPLETFHKFEMPVQKHENAISFLNYLPTSMCSFCTPCWGTNQKTADRGGSCPETADRGGSCPGTTGRGFSCQAAAGRGGSFSAAGRGGSCSQFSGRTTATCTWRINRVILSRVPIRSVTKEGGCLGQMG